MLGARPLTHLYPPRDVKAVTLAARGAASVGSVQQRVDQVHPVLGVRWQSETTKDSQQWNFT
jgi:hypothetical protein